MNWAMSVIEVWFDLIVPGTEHLTMFLICISAAQKEDFIQSVEWTEAESKPREMTTVNHLYHLISCLMILSE